MSTLDLTLRDLQAVTAVARHGHFGRAAQALRVAQPTLSAQVQKVERVLGVRLFERSARRFQVTPEGLKVLPVVRDLLVASERLQTAAVESTGGAAPLRLGLIPTLGPYLAPHLMMSSKKRDRSVPEFTLTEQMTPNLVRGLVEGEIDAALLSLPIRHDSIESITVFDEPFRLLAPRECTLLTRSKLTSRCLCASEMVLLEEGHCMRDQALALCGERGGRRGGAPRIITTSLETLKYVVASGAGYSLIPSLASEIPRALEKYVEVRDFEDRVPCRRIGVCFRKTSPRRAEVEALIAHIARCLPDSVTRAVGAPVGAGPHWCGADTRKRGPARR